MNDGEFKITCMKCGNEQVFKTGARYQHGNNVSLEVFFVDYYNNDIETLDINCENQKCKRFAELEG